MADEIGRNRCLLNTFLVACMIGATVSFVTLMYSGYYRAAGILEWILTYLGSFWMLSFIGFTKWVGRRDHPCGLDVLTVSRFREGIDPRPPTEAERRPLLFPAE